MDLVRAFPKQAGETITDSELRYMMAQDYWSIVVHGNGIITVMNHAEDYFDMQRIDAKTYTVVSVLPNPDI